VLPCTTIKSPRSLGPIKRDSTPACSEGEIEKIGNECERQGKKAE